MASLFECEVRFIIEDIDRFEKRLQEIGASVKYPYEFTDHYFKPANETWNPVEKNLRIREWHYPEHPTTIYFVRNEVLSIDGLEFKRALYHHGKVPLLSDTLEICKALLNDMGFAAWFILKKEKARLWEISRHGFNTVTEYIEGVGWSGELEFEGEDPQKAKTQIEQALNILKIPANKVSFKPISVIFAEKQRFL